MRGKQGFDGVAGREGACLRCRTPGGVEGRDRRLVEEEGCFCLGSKVHRRNS